MYYKPISQEKAKKIIDNVPVYLLSTFNNDLKLVSKNSPWLHSINKKFFVELHAEYFKMKCNTVKAILYRAFPRNIPYETLLAVAENLIKEKAIETAAGFLDEGYTYSYSKKLESDVIEDVRKWLRSEELRDVLACHSN